MFHELQNEYWQTGILSDQGGSLAYGRTLCSGAWVDILRAPDPDAESSPCSFLMLPWANRIRDGILRFDGQEWRLKPTPDDGTARHGDVRKRPWEVIGENENSIQLHFDAGRVDDFNFPFTFTADATYRLEGRDFIWDLRFTSTDERPFPAGFGYHPYFTRLSDSMPLLQIPCDRQFELTDAMADSGPVPIKEVLDFREPKGIADKMVMDDVLTHRTSDDPYRLIYPDWQKTLEIHADNIFKHVLVFTAPDGSLAVEPQTNVNNGFDLYEAGIKGSGVIVLKPGDTIDATVRLRIVDNGVEP